MKGKLSLLILVMAIVAAAGMTSGCGTSYYDETSYEYPNWTSEGLIYCQKSITHYRKEPMGTITLGTDYYYLTMDTDGNNETNLPYSCYPYFSPEGTYVALISGETISIYKRADNSKAYEFAPTSESISALDWGPNEDKIVFRTNKGAIYITNINGEGLSLIKNYGYSVAWKYGNKIVIDTTPEVISINSLDFSEVVNYPNVIGGEFNISPIATNEVIYNAANDQGIRKFSFNSPEAESLLLINKNDLWGIHVSPDGMKIVAHGNNIYGEQIWIINIDGMNLKQLK